MADPLKLLQECAMGRRELREVTHDGKLYYVFGDVAYPHDVKTNLSVYNKPDEYYSIESIIYLWRSRDVQHTTYVKDVSGKGIQAITRIQKRELIDYLRGEQTTLPKDVNVLAPIPTPVPVSRLVDDVVPVQRKKPRLDPRDQEDKGKRIDKILEQSSDRGEAPEVRDLSKDLPAEKIALLRTRVKKNLKNKTIEDDAFSANFHIPDANADSVGKFLQAKERVWKNRTTCLEATSKDFSSVLAALANFKAREKKLAMAADGLTTAANMSATRGGLQSSSAGNSAFQNGRPTANGGAGGSAMRSTNPNTGYSRYDQEIFQKDPIADFQIQTGLSFHGGVFRQIRDTNKPLSASQPTGLTDGQNSSSQQSHTSSQQPNRPPLGFSNQAQPQRPQKRVSRTPIIIIPATGTALITMYNAMEILQDLRFISTEEKKRNQCRRENELLLQIRKNGATVPYRIVDNPLKLKEDEWDRVVAVFVQGPAWQFKGWKIGSNPVEIFTHVAAFHLKFEEQKLDANVEKWSVNILSLSKTKRHLDKAILQKFWDILERHIAMKKPHLRF